MPSRSPSPDDAAVLALDHQLCFALYAASHAMTKAYRSLLGPLGLTYPQYLVMLVLWESDGPSVNQLGERLGLDSGTLTPLLKRLETGGLLHRVRDSGDERRVRIQLSSAGRDLRLRAAAVPRTMATATGCGLAEIAPLVRQLRDVRNRLEATA